MTPIRMLNSAEVWALDGQVVIRIKETMDGMVLVDISDHALEPSAQFGATDEEGNIYYSFVRKSK